MKKLTVTAIFLALLLLNSHSSFAATSASYSGYDNQVSVGFPNVGWNIKDNKRRTTGILGINVALGVGYKGYIKYQKMNELQFTYNVGTTNLVYPYVGLGGDYIWENGIFAGFGINYFTHTPWSNSGGGVLWPELRLGFNF